jgi:protein-L-isoaspartate(D-aspartate) O-methyltransferase
MTVAVHSDFAKQRQTMVDCQIRTFDVTDQAVIARFLDVPREQFVPPALQALVYSDAALELRAEDGVRTLLAPLVLARMIQGAQVSASDRVLDVAGGAGYSAALLAGLAKEVVALESSPSLSALAATHFRSAAIANAKAVSGTLDGASVSGPFDLIFINGAVEEGLEPLLAKLAPGGRLIAVRKMAGHAGKVTRVEKVAGETSHRVLFDAAAPVLDAFARRQAFVF